MCPDLAKYRHLGQILTVLRAYLVFGKVFNPLYAKLFYIGQVYVAVNGRILNKLSNHLWSHWLPSIGRDDAVRKIFRRSA